MEQLIDFLGRWLGILFDGIRSGVASVVSVFDWPGELIGISGEVLAVVVLCAALVALWRAMGGYFT